MAEAERGGSGERQLQMAEAESEAESEADSGGSLDGAGECDSPREPNGFAAHASPSDRPSNGGMSSSSGQTHTGPLPEPSPHLDQEQNRTPSPLHAHAQPANPEPAAALSPRSETRRQLDVMLNSDSDTEDPDAPFCRICYGQDNGGENGFLFSPCSCSGSMGMIHVECLGTFRTIMHHNA